jgi:predicted peptidase
MKATMYAHVGDQGVICDKIVLDEEVNSKKKPKIVAMAGFPVPEPVERAVAKVKVAKGKTEIIPEYFPPLCEYTIAIGNTELTDKDVEMVVEGEDAFEAKKAGKICYRLYSPESKQARPLILFLHGGGECGTDNHRQMYGTIGAIHLAKMYPDMYVMAPQAPVGMLKPGAPMPNMTKKTFANSDMPDLAGWTRPVLGAVCDEIRKMIKEGKVDASRVYVTGLSMGGAGALRALSVGADLFAAGAPICPTMTPETFRILKGLVHTKLWISTAYVDHTIYRHKYIVDGIMALRDAGNNDAHLTLYSPEELEAYGIATDPDMPLQAKFGANHASWILTYHNEYGIMSWLTEQVK